MHIEDLRLFVDKLKLVPCRHHRKQGYKKQTRAVRSCSICLVEVLNAAFMQERMACAGIARLAGQEAIADEIMKPYTDALATKQV